MNSKDMCEIILGINGIPEDLKSQTIKKQVYLADAFELLNLNTHDLVPTETLSASKVDDFCKLNPEECPPIVLLKHSDNSYQIIDGNHRLAAFRKMGVAVIPAYIGKTRKY